MPNVTRIARPSSTNSLRSLGAIGSLPLDFRPELQATYELRPELLHDFFPFNVIRWQKYATQAAVAGEYGGVSITNLIGNDRDALVVVTRIRNRAGATLTIRLRESQAGYTLPALGGAYLLDARGGPIVEFANGFIEQGTRVAAPGDVILDDMNQEPANGIADKWDAGWVSRPFRQGFCALQLWTNAVNTAIAASVEGYVLMSK